MEVSHEFQQRLVSVLEEAVITFCQQHFCRSIPLEVDGIVCVTEQLKRVDHVVKLHRKLFNSVTKQTVPNHQELHELEPSILLETQNSKKSPKDDITRDVSVALSNTAEVNWESKDEDSQRLCKSRVLERRRSPDELDSPLITADHCIKSEPRSFEQVEATECRFGDNENGRGIEKNSQDVFCTDGGDIESFQICEIDDRSDKNVTEIENVFTKNLMKNDTRSNFDTTSRKSENLPTIAPLNSSVYNHFQENEEAENSDIGPKAVDRLIECAKPPAKRINHQHEHNRLFVGRNTDMWTNHSVLKKNIDNHTSNNDPEMFVKTEEMGDNEITDMSVYGNTSLWSQFNKPPPEADIYFQHGNYFTQDAESYLESQEGTSPYQKRYACKYDCGMTFTRTWTRTRHEITRCPKAKSYTMFKCKFCGFQSRRRDEMTKHIRQYHQMPQDYNNGVSDYILSFETLVDE